jgi:hypothetical protein
MTRNTSITIPVFSSFTCAAQPGRVVNNSGDLGGTFKALGRVSVATFGAKIIFAFWEGGVISTLGERKKSIRVQERRAKLGKARSTVTSIGACTNDTRDRSVTHRTFRVRAIIARKAPEITGCTDAVRECIKSKATIRDTTVGVVAGEMLQ